MLAANHRHELIAPNEFLSAVIERIHHPLRRLDRRRFFEGVNAQLVNFGISFIVIEFHVARGIDDCLGDPTGAAAVRNRAFVGDGPDQNA